MKEEGYYSFFKVIILIKQKTRDIDRVSFFLERIRGKMWLMVCRLQGTGFYIPDLIYNIRDRIFWESEESFP